MNGPDCSIEARSLSKTYFRGSEEVRAVDAVSLRVLPGEFVSFVGSSGSGKTTLLNLLGCLDNPTDGELDLDGRPIVSAGKQLSERALTRIRRETFGYIFQSFYLIPTLTVLENVLLPLTFYRSPRADGDALAILERLGIANRRNHRPGQISGGEMQRVAIARALINRPRILLADEPTGNLDTIRATEIGAVLADLNAQEGLTIVMVTHNPEIARLGHRVLEMRDGRILPGSAATAPFRPVLAAKRTLSRNYG
jgi:putative ABC transport system ATP-binding protein